MDVVHQIVLEEDFYHLKEYLETGISPNAQNDDGNTPLHICFYNLNKDSYDFIELLISHGANPITKNKYGYIPIQCVKSYDRLYNYFFDCCKNGNLIVIKHLLSCKINVYSYSDQYKMTASEIAQKYEQEDIIVLLDNFKKHFINDEYLSLYNQIFHCPQWTRRNYILGNDGQKMLFEDIDHTVKTGIRIKNEWILVEEV